MTENRELELYFHIPFCVRKCLYCDFLSFPGNSDEKSQYMQALIREAKSRAEACRDDTVISVFIGGGTPSLADICELEELMGVVREGFTLSDDAELTIEVNPGTADREKLLRLRAAGINRISIGLQSADDGELRTLGRIHTWRQFLDCYENARLAGFENVNVDIMSALPGQSLEGYKKTLRSVIGLNPAPEHISAYSLILEEGTPFYEMARQGRLCLPDEDTDRAMYHETKRLLAQAGYKRYEISNYAREGFACRHNCGYWTRKNYLGLGLGAASLINNTRYNNTSDFKRYLSSPEDCRENVHTLSREEQMEEFMFLGLRLAEGVSCDEFLHCFGMTPDEVYGDVVEKNIRDGLLVRKKQSHLRTERLALSDRGMDLSNYVMGQFLLT